MYNQLVEYFYGKKPEQFLKITPYIGIAFTYKDYKYMARANSEIDYVAHYDPSTPMEGGMYLDFMFTRNNSLITVFITLNYNSIVVNEFHKD